MGNLCFKYRKHFERFCLDGLFLAILVNMALLLPRVVSAQAKRSNPAGDDPGAKLFAAKCEVCHGPDGSAGTVSGQALHAADLTSQAVQSQSDSALIGFISDGKGFMPSFKTALSQQELADLVRHIRVLAANKAKQK